MTKGAYVLSGKRVWVAGHGGMVGAALVRRLESENCEILKETRETTDLRRQADVEEFVRREKPQAVFVAAARVGGIYANDAYPADFLYDNLAIGANAIEASFRAGVEKLLFLGSTCIYPKLAPQPIREESLLTGALEPTNQWYAIAKIAGVKLCDALRRQHGADFVSAMPTNLYGPGDNFDVRTGHVVPALMAKMHAAKLRGERSVKAWGTGKARREFLHVDDCADALVHVMKHYSREGPINIGTGSDLTIAELARLLAKVVGYAGAIEFDSSMPDGTPQKLTGVSRLSALGWKARIPLEDGLRATYAWYVANLDQARGAPR